ncbi:acyltransferase family protein [Ilumatobacter sp.]|uniref:acyltransferase family protein n=1 Tax=Ilumatobacter sp. TaxID=1967498 RepID=UPI003B52EC9F
MTLEQQVRPSPVPEAVERPGGDRTLTYRPELDGLRGLAVLAVLAFHSGWGEPVDGGYLGVSVFFTLSGFLVTQVLLAHHGRTGRLDLARFSSRRVWRLIPAAALTLATIVGLAAVGIFDAEAIRGSVPWAAVHLFNWAEVAAGESYADFFTQPTPVDHFWSLSIEEQFYLGFPLSIALVVAIRARWTGRVALATPWRTTAALCAAAFAASCVHVALAALRGDAAEVYYGTGARAAEIAAGGLVGSLVAGGALRPVRSAIVAALAVAIAISVLVADPVESSWPYRGGLPIFAAAVAVVLAGSDRPGRIRALLSVRPLVAIGTISYGLYLVHWPVFVVVASQPWADDAWTRDLAGWAASFAIALVSFAVVESPLRRGVHSGATTIAVALGVPAALVAASLALPAAGRGTESVTSVDQIDADLRERVVPIPTSVVSSDEPGRAGPRGSGAEDDTAPPVAAGAPTRATAPPAVPPRGDAAGGTREGSAAVAPERPETPVAPEVPPDAPTTIAAPGDGGATDVLLVGDSTAVAAGAGLLGWAAEPDHAMDLRLVASGACGLVRGGTFGDSMLDAALQMDCPALHDVAVPATLADDDVDVVVVMVTLADTWPRSWDGGATTIEPTDPEYTRRIRDDYREFARRVTDGGADRIVWVRPPVVRPSGGGGVERSFTDGSQQVVEAAVSDLAGEFDVAILDLRAAVEAGGIPDDALVRPDGIHLSADASALLAEAYLGEAILDAARRG